MPEQKLEKPDLLDKFIELHNLLWGEGGNVITPENLFKAQEIVDNELLDAAQGGIIAVKQNIDGRIISITRRVARGEKVKRT